MKKDGDIDSVKGLMNDREIVNVKKDLSDYDDG